MQQAAETFYHIAHADDVANCERQKQYTCSSLQSEGFIHCCLAEQLPGVIERYYHCLLYTSPSPRD